MSRTFRNKKPCSIFYFSVYYWWMTQPSNDMFTEDKVDAIIRRFFSDKSFFSKFNSNADDRRYTGKSLRLELKQNIDHQSQLKAEVKKRKYSYD